MLQVFLNIVEFGMEPQEAIEAPRAITHSFPNSFWPHGIQPGEVTVEARVDSQVRDVLRERGHIVHDNQDWGSVSCVCAITVDPDTGVRAGGADPRSTSYAIGMVEDVKQSKPKTGYRHRWRYRRADNMLPFGH